MSLDQRCQQFHEAATGTAKSKGAVKEVATLRKFLYKNQEQRLTDKAVSRLFDTIQIYTKSDAIDNETKEGLLEDSLKMPFTIFSTKHKQKMLKWLEEVRGGGEAETAASTSTSTLMLSVIDVVDQRLHLMNDESGDTFEYEMTNGGDMLVEIAKAFDEEATVLVEVRVGGKGKRVDEVIGYKIEE